MKNNHNKIWKWVVTVSILVASAFFVIRATAGEKEYSVYNYPVRPGSEAWTQLAGHGEMINACQLPEEWLKADTPDLLATVLEYPLLGDLFGWGSFANGVKHVASYFDGLKELVTRSDLMESAKQFNFSDLVFKQDYEKEIAEQVLEYLKQDPDTWPQGNGIQYP